jgi:DNA-binding beta-propeller fold protein YncE
MGLVCLSQLPRAAAAQTFITSWGSYGSGNGQFLYPFGVATDAAGNVYVVDTDNNRIEKFTSDGTYLTQWGTIGILNGQFGYPVGVATDAAGNVYVTDPFNYRVQKFTSDGTYVHQWGTQGTGIVQFSPGAWPPTP